MYHNGNNFLLGITPTPDERNIKMYSPLTLAFLGDAVYSLLVRNMLAFEENKPAGKLHKQSIEYVNASFQARMIKELLPILTDDEESVFKRGRNAHSAHSPKNQNAADYRYATGLEALYGYLYLCGNTARINELFAASTYKYHTKSTKTDGKEQ